MATMKAVQVTKAAGPLELVVKPVPTVGAGQVLVKVHACGVCHSDGITKYGYMPMSYPRVPGHEIAGVVEAVGAGVTAWTKGQRVGMGWHGGHCGECLSCRRGDFVTCAKLATPGIAFDGGYEEYVVAPANALALIPDGMSFVDAAPMMCAGVTTYNCLRHCGARPGDVVAILGVGGLGHLGIQYAKKMGFRTVAVARGKDKEALARQLGADEYIDSTGDAAGALQRLGGAKAILATAAHTPAMEALLGGLAIDGTLFILGVGQEPIKVNSLPFIAGRRAIKGWPSGTAQDSQETMEFSQLTGVKSMNEVFPLEKAAEAFDRMASGAARFRVVIQVAK